MARDQVTISIDPALREMVELTAKEQRRTLSAQICHVLAGSVAGRQTAALSEGRRRAYHRQLSTRPRPSLQRSRSSVALARRPGRPDRRTGTSASKRRSALRWLHNEIARLMGEVGRFERQEQVA